MSDEPNLNAPWLVAVWPGMGNVAISAGYYLMAKLGMHQLAEFSARELFETDHVDVQNGLIRSARLPRSRFFAWRDPNKQHDIVVFIGEAQPPVGKNAFCRKLIQYAQDIGVERVFTFAAMATQMHPEHEARVFAAATDVGPLKELRSLELEIFKEGQIGGLNGVLLGVAAEAGLQGACLLGEIPHIFAQLPFPKASLAVLDAFATMAHLQIDLTELAEQAKVAEQRLGEMLAHVEKTIREHQSANDEAAEQPSEVEAEKESKLKPDDEARIETLFAKAKKDRSRSYELKQLLDQLHVFHDYEDRFLDLFKEPKNGPSEDAA